MFQFNRSILLCVLIIVSASAFSSTYARADDETGDVKTVEINGVIGFVQVRTSPNGVLGAQITRGRKLTAQFDVDGDTLTINGSGSGGGAGTSCAMNGPPNARIEQITKNGVRYNPDDLPRIIITGPQNLSLSINGSTLNGTAGNVGSVEIQQVGCSNFSIGNVSGDFQINVAGSGGTRVGNVSGDVSINIAGAGGVDIAAVTKAVEVNIEGSGNVNLRSGRSGLVANIAGSGSITHAGTAIDPEVNIAGAGNVTVARVQGTADVNRAGSGRFRVN